MTNGKLVLTTAGSREEAQMIARALVERRLAACVNIIPRIQSIYRWKDKVDEAEEWLLVIKTTTAGFARLRTAIAELHSYEVPECICVAIEDGSEQYLRWIEESVD
jgi:periplasmic divalent cation tolerance protein